MALLHMFSLIALICRSLVPVLARKQPLQKARVPGSCVCSGSRQRGVAARVSRGASVQPRAGCPWAQIPVYGSSGRGSSVRSVM